MSNPTELPDLDLDGLEDLCKKAPAMWYGTLQIADGVTDDNAALLIEACSPDTVAELVRLARRAQPEGEAPQAVAFAWAVLAENGNVIIWSKNRGQVEPVSKQYGRPVVPVIALSVAQHAESGKEVAAKPPFPISDDEMAALRRFWECATDGEGYDVEKPMMQRLAEMGLVQRKSGAYYMATEFGLYVLGEYTMERAAQLDGGQEGSESNG